MKEFSPSLHVEGRPVIGLGGSNQQEESLSGSSEEDQINQMKRIWVGCMVMSPIRKKEEFI